MKRILVSAAIAALVLAASMHSAEAQRFGRLRSYYNGATYGPYSGSFDGWGTGYHNSGSPYNNMRNAYYNGYYNTYYPPTSPYPPGDYKPSVATAPATVTAPARPVAPQAPLLGPDEKVIPGENVRAGIGAPAPIRTIEPIVPGPAGSTSPNVGATANP